MGARKNAYAHLHWILLPDLAKPAPENADLFFLSATVRDLASRDGVNRMYESHGYQNIGSFCCIDADRGMLKIARGLECIHSPNVFEPSAIFDIPLAEIVVNGISGQLMAHDEVDRFKIWQQELEKREAQRRQSEAHARELQKKLEDEREKKKEEARKRREYLASIAAAYNRLQSLGTPAGNKLRCLKCNEYFSDWEYIQRDGCVCKQCGEKDRKERLRTNPAPAEQTESHAITEVPHKKELPCLHCHSKTRNWVSFAYPADHPAGVCLCSECYGMGLKFQNEAQSQRL